MVKNENSIWFGITIYRKTTCFQTDVWQEKVRWSNPLLFVCDVTLQQSTSGHSMNNWSDGNIVQGSSNGGFHLEIIHILFFLVLLRVLFVWAKISWKKVKWLFCHFCPLLWTQLSTLLWGQLNQIHHDHNPGRLL